MRTFENLPFIKNFVLNINAVYYRRFDGKTDTKDHCYSDDEQKRRERGRERERERERESLVVTYCHCQ